VLACMPHQLLLSRAAWPHLPHPRQVRVSHKAGNFYDGVLVEIQTWCSSSCRTHADSLAHACQCGGMTAVAGVARAPCADQLLSPCRLT
jgi:hypothetical protein